MLRIIARNFRDRLRPPKRVLSEVDEPLSMDEKETIYALFEVITSHPNFSPQRFLAFLDHRTDLHGEMRYAFKMLDSASAKRFKGLPFHLLTSGCRQKILESILKKYPYRSNESTFRNKFGFTSKNLEVLTTSSEVKSFREFVVRELLAFFYEGQEGWAVVGYDKARGHAIEEESEGEVIDTLEQSGVLLLELADGTFEEFDQANMIENEKGMIWVKGGRQKARLSPEIEAELTAQTHPSRHAVATI